MDLPSHPGSGDDTTTDNAGTTSSRTQVLVIVGIVALVAIFVILHLTGVLGSSNHG
jgi:hypothetical protein